MAVSRWTHAMCGACWEKENPGRPPHMVSGGATDLCCFCGMETTLGIYVRWNPTEVICEGKYMMHLPEEEGQP